MAGDLSFKVDYDIADALRNLQSLEENTSKSASNIEKAFRFQIIQRAAMGAFRYAGEAVQMYAKDNEHAQRIVSKWEQVTSIVKRGIGRDIVGAMEAYSSDMEVVLSTVENVRNKLVDTAAGNIKEMFGGDRRDIDIINKAEADNVRMNATNVQLRKKKELREEAKKYLATNGERLRQAAIFDEYDRREVELLTEANRQTEELQKHAKAYAGDKEMQAVFAERVRNVESKLQYDLIMNEAERNKQQEEAAEYERKKVEDQQRMYERYYDMLQQNELTLLEGKGNLFAKDADRLKVQLKYEQQIRDVQREQMLGEGERARIVDQLQRQMAGEIDAINNRSDTPQRRERGVGVSASSFGSSLSAAQFFLGGGGGGSTMVSEQRKTTEKVGEATRTLMEIKRLLADQQTVTRLGS